MDRQPTTRLQRSCRLAAMTSRQSTRCLIRCAELPWAAQESIWSDCSHITQTALTDMTYDLICVRPKVVVYKVWRWHPEYVCAAIRVEIKRPDP